MKDSRTNDKNKITRRAVANRILCGVALLILVLALCPVLLAGAEESEASGSAIVDVGIPVEEHPELFITRSMPTHGEGKIAVFLIDFPDYRNDNPVATREYYDKLYFSGGVKTNWGETTVAEFYREQSYGKLNLSGQVFDWYTAKHERSYYDNKKAELVMEAAEYYRAQGVDFSQFDGDGDGVIDAVTFHFAGDYSTSRNNPWYGGLKYDYGGTVGDMKFTTMVQVYEDAKDGWNKMIETICHELMHTLGMPDLYSEVARGVDATTDLMSGNNPTINPYTKILLGWIDTVKVIAEDTDNIRLDLYGNESPGSVAIVTDSFNGLFDEFYLVAYRQYKEYTYAVIWHIDARLNESGSGFAYQNLYYTPRPDKDNPHATGYSSPYLFIEEISADPSVDFILNPPVLFDETAFDEDSVLGPDSIPSSDTHDGEYTGIKIDNFVEHNEEYLTFDVSFVEDNSAPVITTSEDDLEFKETVTIEFNEHIYAGDNWKTVKVTDQDGNPLDATVILPHYPRNEIEITFKTDAYLDGYKIVIPEGAVKDSSGNEIAAVTLSASKEHYIFPISDKTLPNTAEYLRNSGEAAFFPDEDSLVIITSLLENRNGEYVQDAKVEFMRLDYNGNVLTQTIVDNPFENSDIISVIKTGDGCYVFLCRENIQSGDYDLLFCVDQNGNLKWTNDVYFGSGVTFFAREGYCSFKLKDGLVMEAHDSGKGMLMRISSETGEIYDCTSEYGDSDFYGYEFFDLENERVMVQKPSSVNGKHYVRWELVDVKTGKAIAQAELEGSWEYDYYIQQVKCNDDGTIMLTCFMGQSVGAMLLDVDLNVIKSVQLRRIESDGNQMVWLENDGFCEIDRIVEGDHDNDQFHIRRYDRYLNFIWESDVIAHSIYYFKSPSGEIIAYKSACKSMLEPDECYIEYYGSEEDRRVEHTHSLVYAEPIEATCINLGSGEYWCCTDCGVRYSDEGLTPIVDMQSLNIPLTDHTKVTIPATDPTCGASGRTEEIKCSVCGEIFIASQKIPAIGNHSYSEWTVTTASTCVKSGTKARECSACGKKETSWLPSDNNAHDYGEWKTLKEPTVESEGEERRVCGVCGKDEVRLIEKLAPPEATDPPEAPETPEDKPNDLWWIAIVVGIGAVMVLSFTLINKSKKSKQ